MIYYKLPEKDLLDIGVWVFLKPQPPGAWSFVDKQQSIQIYSGFIYLSSLSLIL